MVIGINQIDYGILEYLKAHDLEEDSSIYRIVGRMRDRFELANRFIQGIQVSTGPKEENLVIGDFVQVTEFEDKYFITKRLERSSLLSKAANTTSKSLAYSSEEQLLAANVDQLFILIAADQRFTLSKFERYLLTFSGMVDKTHVLISKSDYQTNAEKIYQTIKSVYSHIPVIYCSILQETLMLNILSLFNSGQTSVLIGASGSGKSTLINYLAHAENITTQSVRSDGKGKHTTTTSYLYYLSQSQSYIIDTPGFKSIASHRDLNEDVLFKEINDLSCYCKFFDCKHDTEPGCAVQEAISKGEISPDLLDRYQTSKEKMRRFESFQLNKQRKKEAKMKRR